MRNPVRRIARTTTTLAAAGVLAGCAYNEDLGRSQFLLVDDAALAGAAEQAWGEALGAGKVSTNRAAIARVERVAKRLIEAAGLGDRPWQYVVFEDPQANAFVLPGGRIGVNTGLLALARTDDQLAAVIGHELAHSVANHAAERYSQTAATQTALQVGQAALGGRMSPQTAQAAAAFGGLGAQLGLLMPFSRRHELEADRLGVDYMARAGYRPGEALELWRTMAREGAGGRPPQFLSTHPSEATRLAELERYLASRGWLEAG
ncbi:M48 family metallopeptidase [Phenylobacterium terrae]|uniref:M48 family metallopeptidase n=1 Tax=Phenylobacterium terrae TaxID=2665495 RepID=A0ABW4N243_9CAUL